MRRFLVSALAVLSVLLPTLPAGGSTEAPRLVKAVILCRHGLRSPTQTPQELAQWSPRPWPEWNVAPGKLTERGALLLRYEGRLLRQHLSRHGLLPPAGQLKPESIFLYADKNSRTKHSAEALLEGLAPEVGTAPLTYRGKGKDPLFHTIPSGLMAEPDFNAEERRALVQELERIRRDEARPLARLFSLLSPSMDTPDALRFPAKGTQRGVTLRGGLHTAASTAEILLLQCLEWPVESQSLGTDDWSDRENIISPVEEKTLQILNAPESGGASSEPPAPQKEPAEASAAPLMVNPQTALELLPVHAAVQNALQRARPQALTSGLPLLAVMTGILAGTSPLDGANSAALSILVGHDTNISNVAGLLGLHWKNGEFPPDSAPPGSMLCFTLWEGPQGKIVKAAFLRQSLAALLTTDRDIMENAALYREELRLPGASIDSDGGTTLEDFANAVLDLASEPGVN